MPPSFDVARMNKMLCCGLFFVVFKQLVDKVVACHAFFRDYEGVPPADPPGDRPEAMRPRV